MVSAFDDHTHAFYTYFFQPAFSLGSNRSMRLAFSPTWQFQSGAGLVSPDDGLWLCVAGTLRAVHLCGKGMPKSTHSD